MPSDHQIWGLYFLHERRRVVLDLTAVDVVATVKDVSATVKVTQTYTHSSTTYGTIEARYAFPLPARAAVASFVLVKQNGDRVVGKVQEKVEAKKTYEKARAQGKLAALMDQHSPDVFQVNVGNVKPNETVKVELCYSTELTEDEENDSIRLSLPTVIGARYGDSPFRTALTQSTAFLSIKANIESLSPIAKIGSPSHTIETELGPDPSLLNAQSLPFSNYARVELTSSSPLDKDFILTLRAAGLDAPRCLAEIHPTKDTVALSLTLVPRFKLPDVPKQEFIFLVDRSGSMDGTRMETAKKALVNMIHSLPHKGSAFNIVSFGSTHKAHWPSSREYNQSTLESARKHIDGMEANFGGTEILSALESVFKVRQVDRPTSVFVLTDGDAWDLDASLEAVSHAVKAATPEAYLRVFTLGIGNSASTAMVEGIARRGNGSSSFVNDNESFTGKTARLLKAARAPLVNKCRVDWGVGNALESSSYGGVKMDENEDFELVGPTTDDDDAATLTEKTKILLFDEKMDEPLVAPATQPPPPPLVVLPESTPIQQSPYAIKTISPSTRLYVYAILGAPAWQKGDPLPKSVILRGSLASGQEVELEVPVTQSQLPTTDTSQLLPVHTLAARKLIQDLGDGQNEFADAQLDPDTLQATEKAAIVRLAKEYSLMSKYTSFVAVDEVESPIDGKLDGNADRTKIRSEAKMDHESEGELDWECDEDETVEESRESYRRSSIQPPGGPTGNSMMRSRKASPAFASFGGAGIPPPPPAPCVSYGALPPPPPSRGPAPVGFASPYMSAPLPQKKKASSSGIFSRIQACRTSVIPPSADQQSAAAPDRPPRIQTDADRLDALVRHQSFDGSFAATSAVVQLCQVSLSLQQVVALLPKEVGNALGKRKEKVAITLLVLVFFEKKLGGERDSWESVSGKANDFVTDALATAGAGSSVEKLREIFTASI